jgi:hypothetical protein
MVYHPLGSASPLKGTVVYTEGTPFLTLTCILWLLVLIVYLNTILSTG